MAKLSPEQIRELAPRLKSVESIEPLACAWRYQAETGTRSSLLRAFLGILRDARTGRRQPESPGDRQVVALTWAATSATLGSMRPVLEELRARGRPVFLVTGPRTRGFAEEGLHLGSIDIMELLGRVPVGRRTRNLTRARRISRVLRSHLPRGFDGDCTRWLENALSMREIVSTWITRAGCVISDSDMEAPRMGFIAGARCAKVPTLVLQHGFFGEHQFPLHADRLLCWGGYFVGQAAALGLEPSRAAAVGCPRWDHLPELRRTPRNPAVAGALGWSGSAAGVLVISNAHGSAVYPEHYDAFFKTVGRLVEAGIETVVKLHPNEPGIEPYVARLGPSVASKLRVVPAEISLHEAVRHADVAYTVFSAAALEAMVLGVPVLFESGANDRGRLCDLPDDGGGKWCCWEDAVDLVETLAREGEPRQRVLADQDGFLGAAFANLGRAAPAIADEIEGVVEWETDPRRESS